MNSKALLALVVCGILAGTAVGGIARGDADMGHDEPKSVTAMCWVDSADVSWDPVPNPQVAGYDVYRRAAGEPDYTKVNGNPVQANGYQVGGLAPGTTYDFGVVALYSDGHSSAMSYPATCTTT